MFGARPIQACLLVVAFQFASATPLHAQGDRGTLTGQVTDQSNAIIPGASVKAVHVATNFERQVTTSSEGSYTITQLPVGSYVVIVTVQNFQTTTLENIEVTAGSTVRVDAQLRVGAPAGCGDGDLGGASDTDRQREGDLGDQQQVHPGSAARRRRAAPVAA